jgi:hydrogenase nickel incorporation protein HypA/HybF
MKFLQRKIGYSGYNVTLCAISSWEIDWKNRGFVMHELSLAGAVNKTIKDLCERSGWVRVRRVILKIGHMRQVDPELLSFAFNVVSKGTVSEGAELLILELPIVFKCHVCGKKIGSEASIFICQDCGSTNVELLSGMELTIESMEVEARQ